MNPLPLLRQFLAADARIALIGGLAAVLHGVPLVTNDIDLCYDTAADNRDRIVAVLAPLHPSLRVGGMTAEEARSLPFFWDSRTLRDNPNVSLDTDAGPIDLAGIVPGIGTFADVLAVAQLIDVDGIAIPVLDLSGLILAAQAAGRPRNLIEVTFLKREVDSQE